MLGFSRKIALAAAVGALVAFSGLSGCSSLSTDHVDCNVVKLQAESGRSDAEIASAIGASVADVAKCHSTPSSGSAGSQSAPSGY